MDKTDVLIIGGGLTGCATAYHLAKSGSSVTLLERCGLNAGASGQNAGSLHFQIERRFLEQGDKMAEQAACIVALNRMAIDEWAGVEAELGCDLEVVRTGGLMVAETAEEMALLEKKMKREHSYDLPTKLVDKSEIRKIAPYLADSIIGAAWMEVEGHANPRLITPAFANAAARNGASILQNSRVTSIARHGSGFVVSAERDGEGYEIKTDKILLAAGAWTAEVAAMANLHLPVFPAGLMMNITERVKPFIHHLIQHVGRRLSVKQAHSGNVLIGGGWPSLLNKGPGHGFNLELSPVLREENIWENLRTAVSTIPEIKSLNLIRSWTGTVALTSDQLPILGEVPRMRGLYVAAGGSGFTLGLTFARYLSEIILRDTRHERAEIFDLFSPARFEHLNSFMG